jgi:tetratricopeptide (TPR) repeat protein
LTTSYDKILKNVESLYKNKETFYKEINNYCYNNREKYPKLSEKEVTGYKQNIINWRNKRNKGVYNANWNVLVPVLDFLLEQNKKDLVRRLIGLYLLKNAQRAIKEILDISETEQNQIIFDIITMIKENRKPEEFYNENDFLFPLSQQVNLINMCLAYQASDNLDVVKIDGIINFIKEKCVNSGKFFSPWLKARASVFLKGETLKENKEEQESIINGYKTAYDEGVAYAGGYLALFLLEAIVINRFYNPYGKKDNFHGYGYALELFGPEKEKLLDIIFKDSCDLKKVFDDIHYSSFNPLVQNIFQNYPALHSLYEFINEAKLINDKGLEFENVGNFEQATIYFSEAIMLNPIYVNAYSNRGNVYKKMSEYNIEYIENALTDFNIVLLLDPKHENTLFNRGLLFLERYQYENAITDFSNLIKINPEDSEAYLLLRELNNAVLLENRRKNTLTMLKLHDIFKRSIDYDQR